MSRIFCSVEVDVIAAEGAARLQEAMQRLGPVDRVIVMGVALDKTYEEIGLEIGISKQAAHKRAERALGALRQQLALLGYRSIVDFGISA